MSTFYTFKFVSKTQYNALERANSAEEVKEELVKILGLFYEDTKKQGIASDLFFYLYAFCKDHAFDGAKTSTFLSIMRAIFQHDGETPGRSMTASYEWFEAVLARHCVDRIPYSVKVFDDHEVADILEFVVDTYFRQFRMYNYIFGVQARVRLVQLLPQAVEKPEEVAPLSTATENAAAA
jgi:hypothetical protein